MSAKLPWLKGVFPALVTPFGEEEEVDEKALRSLVRHVLDDVDGLVPCGTTGEFPYLSMEEQRKIIEIVVEEAQDKKPVIAGTCASATHQAINLAKQAQKVGASACLVVTPYFLHPSPKGIYQHFYEVAKAVDIPVIMYNIPQTVDAYLPPEVIEDLSEIPNIVGLKDSSGNLAYILEIIERVEGRIDVLVGNDEVVVPALVAGCSGAILMSANVFPDIWQKAYKAVLAGNLEVARSYQMNVQKLTRIFGRYGAGLAVKSALNMMGIKVGKARRPLKIGGTLLHEVKAEIQLELEKLGKIKSPNIKFSFPEDRIEQRFSDIGLYLNTLPKKSFKLGSGMYGDGLEKVGIDIVAGPKKSPLGFIYAEQFTHPRHGYEALTAILEPNLAVKPSTLIIPTVPLKNLRQANMIYGPSQAAIGKAIADKVSSGIIPTNATEEEVILAKLTVHPKALNHHVLYKNVYQAMSQAITRAYSYHN
ncbi:4-hydroxy-tetrahydrodipicolinate synthase [Candidatus Aerophobetes bacterium]|nr:4-hydroxy-tetrahydrodipicolinate synthase [Candidatus Aerophobetes bacterium]